jgi:hypothetical protein
MTGWSIRARRVKTARGEVDIVGGSTYCCWHRAAGRAASSMRGSRAPEFRPQGFGPSAKMQDWLETIRTRRRI